MTTHLCSNSCWSGPREAQGIVSYLKKRAGPASKELTTVDEATAMQVRREGKRKGENARERRKGREGKALGDKDPWTAFSHETSF